MSLVSFTEDFIHMDVLCVEKFRNFTLAGIGSTLFVYNNKTLKLMKRIFVGERIHKIDVADDLILLKGGRELALVTFPKNSGELKCQVLSNIQCSDWIQDVLFLNHKLVGLTTAHNVFELWDLPLQKCVKVHSCEEKCILYSCKIIGNSLDNILIFSGTVFGDVLVWAPLVYEGGPIKRFKGHNGAVFSIEANTTEKILLTTSDDRSLRIWFVTAEEPLFHPKAWKNAKIDLNHTLYGHTARVWRSLATSNFYVTIGEDSQLIVWKKDGRPIKVISLHQESGMRTLHYSHEEMSVTTGGGDGGINALSWNFLSCEAKAVERLKNFDIGQNFSTRVCFIEDGFIYTINGGLAFVSNTHEEILYKNENFEAYCILEVSSDYIVLGSMRGHLVLIDAKTKIVLVDGQFVDGRVYSIHCLGSYLLTCGPNGQLSLWEYSKGMLNTVKRMTLPACKERWSTCGVIHDDYLVVGDRMGNLHVFELSGGENPSQSFRKIHSYLGVTDVFNDGDVTLTVGRDGTLKTFTGNLSLSTTNKLPMEWPWKIASYRGDVLILGFRSVSFVVWSMTYREIIASHNCGGGHRSCDFKIHQNKLTFLYVKDKKFFTVDMNLNEITRIRKGFHRSEINSLKILHTNPPIIVTGSEDTTLRISRIEKSEIEETVVLKTHVSSIRAVSVCSMTPGKFLIVSAGGKAQIVIWTFNLESLRCQEMVNRHLKQETRNWKSPSLEIDPETRFMCVDILKQENAFVIATGCSDCMIRIFSYGESFNLLTSISYTHCVLKVAILNFESRLLVVSMGTDGRAVFWDITDSSNTSRLGSFVLHQSGINSFHLEEVEGGRFILATGGDDNLISVALVELSQDVNLRQIWKSSTSHSCQITGIKILNDILLTASIDQRITVWRWSLERDDFQLRFLDQYMTPVPDLQGMDAILVENGAIRVSVYGKGMEIFNVNVCSVNQDKG